MSESEQSSKDARPEGDDGAGADPASERRALRCAQCRKEIDGRGDNPHFPFCSERCRYVDLGKWFGEDYRIAVSPTSTERSLPGGPDEGGHDDPEW
jgi:hypothetical protein